MATTPDWTTLGARLRALADVADRGDVPERVIAQLQLLINDMRALARLASWARPRRA